MIRTLILLAALLSQSSALADSMRLPKHVGRSFSGNYVIRAQLTTKASTKNLKYGVFATDSNDKIGEPLKNVSLRPQKLTVRADTPRTVVAIVPQESVPPQSKLALCMWREEQETASKGQNQLRFQFRYCRLFNIQQARK